MRWLFWGPGVCVQIQFKKIKVKKFTNSFPQIFGPDLDGIPSYLQFLKISCLWHPRKAFLIYFPVFYLFCLWNVREKISWICNLQNHASVLCSLLCSVQGKDSTIPSKTVSLFILLFISWKSCIPQTFEKNRRFKSFLTKSICLRNHPNFRIFCFMTASWELESGLPGRLLCLHFHLGLMEKWERNF